MKPMAADLPTGPMRARKPLLLAGLALLAAACGPRPPAAMTETPPPSAWTAPPRVTEATMRGGVWIVTGQATPNGRVALRRDTGEAFAASADRQGVFTVRAPVAGAVERMAIEAQRGQNVARRDWLLLPAAEFDAPAVVVSPGAGARVLGPPALIQAIDYDGASQRVSGRVQPGEQVTIVNALGQETTVTADAEGRFGASAPPGPVRVRGPDGERRAEAPATTPLAPEAGASLRVATGGWAGAWRLEDGAVQSIWIAGPDTD